MSQLSRRRFLTLLGAATVTPLVPIELAQPEVIAEAEFGFTWGNVKAVNPTYTEIITTTLKGRTKEIADNLSRNNALLLRLQNNQAIKVTKIDKMEQWKRIDAKVTERRKNWDKDFRADQHATMSKTIQRHKTKVVSENTGSIYYEGYEQPNFVVKEA